MFHKLIQRKSDEWYNSSDCTVKELIQYIHSQNKMRDAQLEAIKIYLFLKIACGNKPLYMLFNEGAFNNLDLENVPLTIEARKVLTTNKAAASLLEYSLLQDRNGNQLAPELEKYIKSIPDFPIKGILFRDVTGILDSAEGFQLALDELQKSLAID